MVGLGENQVGPFAVEVLAFDERPGLRAGFRSFRAALRAWLRW